METVSRTIGRCLTETKLKDFDDAANKFADFALVSQFDSQPKDASQVKALIQENKLSTGYILYGVNPEDGTLTWLGQIIDSSD